MSLITRCPLCRTSFRVVPDQLRIASGLVRCGHCGEIFDGSAHLQGQPEPLSTDLIDLLGQGDGSDAVTEPLQAAPADPMQNHPVTPPVRDTVESEQLPVELKGHSSTAAAALVPFVAPVIKTPAAAPTWERLRAEEPESGQPEPPEDTRHATAPAVRATADPEQGEEWCPSVRDPRTDAVVGAEVPEEVSIGSEVDRAAIDPPDVSTMTASETVRVPPTEDAVEVVETISPTEQPAAARKARHDTPTFVVQARQRAFWDAGPMRAGLWLVALLLGLGLVGQLAVQQRDWLAARYPQLMPALTALCQPIDCRVHPYRRLEAIVIDGSSFNRASSNEFNFSVTLRNSANLPLATPALELALTDLQERVLVRRVLLPSEIGAPRALAARGEFNGASVLSVAAAAEPSAITGYRLVAFYP